MRRLCCMLVILSLTILSAFSQDAVNVITPDKYKEAMDDSIHNVILDVRRPMEYSDGHLAKAILLDWSNQEIFKQGVEKLPKEKTYYIYCKSGKRSHAAALMMQSKGFKVFDMQGGILNWNAQGFPIEK